jgi:hypothetical protein
MLFGGQRLSDRGFFSNAPPFAGAGATVFWSENEGDEGRGFFGCSPEEDENSRLINGIGNTEIVGTRLLTVPNRKPNRCPMGD